MRNTTSLIIFLTLIFLSACHSFYRINVDALQEINKNDIVQINLESGEAIKIKNIRQINLLNNQELEFIKYTSAKYKVDSTRLVFSLSEINDVRVERVDVQKTIFTSFWITISTALVIVVLFFPEGFTH